MGVTKYNKKTGRRIRNKSTGRDYKKEYANYQGKPEQIKRRSSRNSARAAAVKSGKAKKGDGKDIAHKNGNPKDNKLSNLKSQAKGKNRSYKRTSKARKKDPRS